MNDDLNALRNRVAELEGENAELKAAIQIATQLIDKKLPEIAERNREMAERMARFEEQNERAEQGLNRLAESERGLRELEVALVAQLVMADCGDIAH